MATTAKKFTRASLKSFIKKNINSLYIKEKSSFNGMSDCVEEKEDFFTKVDSSKIDFNTKYSFWISWLWLTWSRDFFTIMEDWTIEICNCCGTSYLKAS